MGVPVERGCHADPPAFSATLEATGYGLVYYVQHMLEYAGQGTLAGKRVAISGSGNVSQYAALKCIELGATVVSLSDSKGAVLAEEGVTAEQVHAIAELKLARKSLTDYDHGGKFKYIEGARPWVHVGKVDIVLPCATQNEVSKEEAEALVAGGARFIAEGSNMGCTQEAIDVFESERKAKGAESIWYAPGKASNCGGVAVSGLEMAQNSQVRHWSRPSPSLAQWHRLLCAGLTLGLCFAASELDLGGGGREAQGHHEGSLPQRSQHGEGVRSRGRGRAAQLGGWQQHCRFRQGGKGDARPGRLVVVWRRGQAKGDNVPKGPHLDDSFIGECWANAVRLHVRRQTGPRELGRAVWKVFSEAFWAEYIAITI